jgi:hypothetical protein
MDAVDILKVCIRRWYVMLPILLGAAGVSYQLAQSQETTYTAAASYGLVQPSLTPEDRANDPNPLGSAGDVLIGAALEAQLNSRETQELLGGGDTRGWGPGQVANGRSYDVRIPQFETTYEVRAWGEDEQEVREVVERVIKAAPEITDELQVRAQVPPSQRYKPFVLAPTQVAALPTSGWVKLALAVMGVGLLMGAAWSVIVDRVLRWRPARRQAPDRSGAPRADHDLAARPGTTGAAARGSARSEPRSGTPPATSDVPHDLTGDVTGDVTGDGAASLQINGQLSGRPSYSSAGRPGVRPSGKPAGKPPGRVGRKASGRR